MPQEFFYTFTDEERQGLIVRLELLLQYIKRDLTFPEEKKKVLISKTHELKNKIEHGHE